MTSGAGIPPPPQGRDCGKWLYLHGFQEGPFGLRQAIDNEPLGRAIWCSIPTGAARRMPADRWRDALKKH